MESAGISLHWDNSTIQTDVDDSRIVPGAYDLELRFPRCLCALEIEQVEALLERRLYPAFLEAQREVGPEGGTCFRAGVSFLEVG
jgi:hypothetical protein